MKTQLKDIDVVILCGGKGTRLHPVVSDRPKGLARFGNKPFLDILIEYVISQGFRRIILCVGYMKEHIIDYYKHRDDISISFSEEYEPFGTGGAVKNAKSLIQSRTFLVMNGDSICQVDLHDFYQFHINEGVLLSMVLARKTECQDYGSVLLNNKSEIISFTEKRANTNQCLINAGVYCMQQDVFACMPGASKFSLENDFFPTLTGEQMKGFIINGALIDIGTPDRYEKAVHLMGGKQ